MRLRSIDMLHQYFGKNRQQGNRKPVLIEGVRSAFVKSNGIFEDLDSLELFSRVINALLAKSSLRADLIDEIIAGSVIPQTKNPNVARDSILNLGLPSDITGYSLNRTCASGLQSIINAATNVMAGRPSFTLAGGVECLSDLPVVYSREARKFLVKLTKANSASAKLNIIKQFRAKAWVPKQPEMIEPLTGLHLGEYAEFMAQENIITRESQDAFALMSHKKAILAKDKGVFNEEIVPVWAPPQYSICVNEDNCVLRNQNIKYFNELEPIFDKNYGTITSANSSSLTDGAAVCLIGDQQLSERLGLAPKVEILDFETIALNPKEQPLIGPAIAMVKLLLNNDLHFDNIDRFEIHEAFAAQILSCLEATKSKKFVKKYFGSTSFIGEIASDKLNVNGGSIAIGHPFGATGVRLLISLANELMRQKLNLGVVSMCGAGAMATAMLVRRIS